MDWMAVGNVAAMISALCAVIAAAVTVAVWRKSRSDDVAGKIDAGDRASRAHAQRGIDDLQRRLTPMAASVDGLRQLLVRMESEQAHYITARDLGPLHEKINDLAKLMAAGQAQTHALHEQLITIQNYLMKNLK